MDEYWPIIAPLAVIAIAGIWKLTLRGVQWIAHEISQNVVQSIGDTLAVRWNEDMDTALEPIMFQLRTNGGNSLRDVVNEINDRLSEVEGQLETEFSWKPRRRRPYDEGDAYPI